MKARCLHLGAGADGEKKKVVGEQTDINEAYDSLTRSKPNLAWAIQVKMRGERRINKR